MAKTPKTVTIPAGQTLSGSVDLTSGSLAMVVGPSDWSPANISFQVSSDNTIWADLFDLAGVEVIKPIRVNSAVILDPTLSQAVNYLRVRSGPRDNPIPQAADRVLTLVIV